MVGELSADGGRLRFRKVRHFQGAPNRVPSRVRGNANVTPDPFGAYALRPIPGTVSCTLALCLRVWFSFLHGRQYSIVKQYKMVLLDFFRMRGP